MNTPTFSAAVAASLLAALVALVALLIEPQQLHAQATVTWDGSGDMNWTQPDNTSWSGDTYNSGDHAQFLGGGAGTVSITGTVTPGSVLVNSGANYTFSGGSIGGSASLTKSGTGLLVLSAANTYNGATIVNGGILRPTVASAIPTDPTINAGGTFDINGLNFWNTNPRTFTIAGTGAAGTVGALTTTAGAPESQVLNVTLSDNATIGTSAGKLNLRGALDGGGNTLTIAGSGETNIRPSASVENLAGIVIGTTGGGRLRFESDAGGGTLNPASLVPITVNPGGRLDTYVAGANRTYGPNFAINLNGGILEANGNSGNIATWQGPVTVSANSSVHTNRRTDLFGELSGPGVLTKTGTDILAIRGGVTANLGGIVINQGIVRTENAGFGNWNGPVTVNSGGTLNSWGTQSRQVQVNLNGGTLSSSGGGNHSWTGPINVTANSAVVANDRIDFFGLVSGTGVITKSGGNVLVFRGGVDSLGGLVINTGRVRFENAAFGAWGGPITINSGGILSGWGNQTLQAAVNLDGGTMSVENNGTGTYNGAITGVSASTIATGPGGIVINGPLSGAADLAKTGAGLLQINGNATGYTGTLTINQGVLQAANTNALPVNVSIASGATLNANGVNFGPRDITIAGTGAPGFVGAWTNTGAGEGWIRGIALTADATIGTNGAKINSNGTIDGGGNTLTIAGGGETNFRGGTQLVNLAGINVNTTGGGRLRLEGDIAPAAMQTISVQPGARVDTWANRNLGSNLALNLNGGVLEAQGSGGATTATWQGPVEVSANSTVNTTSGGGNLRNITLAGPLSGSGDVNKTGPGTLQLTGDNTGHSGDIAVNEGTLLVNNTSGSGTGSGMVTVASGARLGGEGSIGTGAAGDGVLVQAGGTFAPGNSPGTITLFGTLTLDPGAIFEADIRNPGTDLAIVHDQVSIGGSLLQGTWGGGNANLFQGTYTSDVLNWLIRNESGSPITGTFANSVAGPGFAGLFDNVTPHLTTVDGQLFAAFYEADFTAGPFTSANLTSGNDLLLIAIPEPTRALMLAMAGLLVVLRRRRPCSAAGPQPPRSA